MSFSSSSWTAERVARLKALWLAGRSAAEIAKALGGTTRNAVIGKIHRLGLAGRMAPSAPRRARRARRERPRALAGRSAGAPKPPPLPPPPPAAPARRARTPRVERVEAVARVFDAAALTARTCHWPVGDPRAAGFGYCGAPVVGRGPYCPGHHQAAYPPRLQVRPESGAGAERPRRSGAARAW